jgi:hypothetical protein
MTLGIKMALAPVRSANWRAANELMTTWRTEGIGRESRAQVVAGGGDREALAFPGEVVMVGDGRQARFGDRLRQGQAEGDIHGKGEGVLDQQQVDLETLDEALEVGLEVVLEPGDLERRLVGAARPGEERRGQVEDGGVGEVSLRDDNGALGGGIAFPGEVEALQAEIGQGVAPLLGLQRDTIRPGEAGRYESDVGRAVSHRASKSYSSGVALAGS